MAKRRRIKGFIDTGGYHKAAGMGGLDLNKYNGDCMARAWSVFLDIPYKEMWDICAGMNWNAGRERTGDNRVREWKELVDHFGLIRVEVNEEEPLKTISDWYQIYDSFLCYDYDNKGWYHWRTIKDGIMYDLKSKKFEYWWRFWYGEAKPKVVMLNPNHLNPPRLD